ncbi:MAG: hypothetical protein HPY82_05730 [Gammaproteobacteria bacterium]|nr:hypothetical protein [Gammaproteobacteria bacterium]
MPVTRAGGYVNYSTNTSNYIPEIFSGKLVRRFYDTTVFAEIANTDYEGEIKSKGDVVHIRTRPDIVIDDYEVGAGLGTAQTPTSASVALHIDRAKRFNIGLTDLDALQSDVKLMDEWADAASETMRVAIDNIVLANIYADAASFNAGATAGRISGDIDLGTASVPLELAKDNILDVIVDYGVCLDEANCPEQGRFIVLPAWACGLIKKSDLKDASLAGDGTSIMRNGRVGMVDRFTLFMSNNVAKTGSNFHVIAGHKEGITFASQMTKSRIIPDQGDFRDLLQGLNVFGFETINPALLLHSVVKKGAV